MAAIQPSSTGRVVNPDVLQLSPSLLNAPLATPWQRLGGMTVDLILISLLSRLSTPLLGICAGATLTAFGNRSESDARFWLAFRWVLIGLGIVIMVLSAFLAGGRPLLRPLRPVAEVAFTPAEIPVNATPARLRAEVERLQTQVEVLQEENVRFRDSTPGQTIYRAVSDLPRGVGLAFGWAGVYFTLLTRLFRGRTPGKFVFGSRVVRLDGRPPTAIDCFWRSGGYPAGLATGCLGFLRLIWDPNHQALQDNIAGTLVLSTRRQAKSPAGPAGQA